MKPHRNRLLALLAVIITICSAARGAETVKVGVLHSLSGTMAISETSLKDALLFTFDEINKSGGVMGKMVDAQSITIATAATAQVGNEGIIFRFVVWHSIALGAIVAIIVLLYAYVFSNAIPHGLTFAK